jgi:hypothetical protein
MLPALIATWLPNHDKGGMSKEFFHSFPLIKGGIGKLFSTSDCTHLGTLLQTEDLTVKTSSPDGHLARSRKFP